MFDRKHTKCTSYQENEKNINTTDSFNTSFLGNEYKKEDLSANEQLLLNNVISTERIIEKENNSSEINEEMKITLTTATATATATTTTTTTTTTTADKNTCINTDTIVNTNSNTSTVDNTDISINNASSIAASSVTTANTVTNVNSNNDTNNPLTSYSFLNSDTSEVKDIVTIASNSLDCKKSCLKEKVLNGVFNHMNYKDKEIMHMKKEMTMNMNENENKDTNESNGTNEISDTNFEHIINDKKTIAINFHSPKKEHKDPTFVDVSTKVEETDSDDEPLIKKFEKELQNLQKKQIKKEHEQSKIQTENEKTKKKSNAQLNTIATFDETLESSDDESLLTLAKREYAKKMVKADASEISSDDSDKPILMKSKNEFLRKMAKENLVNIHTHSSTNISLSNAKNSVAANVGIKEIGVVKGTDNSTPKNSTNKSKVQKSIKKSSPKKNTTRKKKNITNNSTKTVTRRKTKSQTKTAKKQRKRKGKGANTKSNAKAKSERKKKAATKSRRTVGRNRKSATRTDRNKNYNTENESIVIGNFDPHNRSNKEKLVAKLLIRWWYVLPDWPTADYNYDEELKKRKLKLVPLEEYEDEEDVDEQGFRKVYQISAFPGVFRDALGTAYDLRDKNSCPSFNNLMKKTDHELLDLICQAIKNQLKCLKNSVYNESFNEKRLEKELKDMEARLSKIVKKEKINDKSNEERPQEEVQE